MYTHTPESYQRAFTSFAMNQPTLSPEKSNSPPTAPRVNMNERMDYTFGRRMRTEFTYSQTIELEREFKKTPYLQGSRRIEIATRLGLNEQQVKVWFQNRRVRWKRKPIETNGMIVKKISVDGTLVTQQTSQSENANPNNIQRSCKNHNEVPMEKLPVIRPLKAQIVKSQLPSEVPVPIVTKTIRTFKPQVIVKIPVVTSRKAEMLQLKTVGIVKPTYEPRQSLLKQEFKQSSHKSILKPKEKESLTNQFQEKKNETKIKCQQSQVPAVKNTPAGSTSNELYNELYSDLLDTLDKLLEPKNTRQAEDAETMDMDEFLVFQQEKVTQEEDKAPSASLCSSPSSGSNTVENVHKSDDDIFPNNDYETLSPIVTLSFDDIIDI